MLAVLGERWQGFLVAREPLGARGMGPSEGTGPTVGEEL